MGALEGNNFRNCYFLHLQYGYKDIKKYLIILCSMNKNSLRNFFNDDAPLQNKWH